MKRRVKQIYGFADVVVFRIFFANYCNRFWMVKKRFLHIAQQNLFLLISTSTAKLVKKRSMEKKKNNIKKEWKRNHCRRLHGNLLLYSFDHSIPNYSRTFK